MEVSEMDYMAIRASFAAADKVRDAGLTAPADVVGFTDIPYGPHDRWNLLDVYRPKAAKDALLPCIVSVHGGGWVYGDKDLYRYYCMDLARRGFAVVDFSYRLAPEDPFPAAVEDVNAAFTWTADHAGDYHMDMERLFVVGDSAGGQLACQYIAMLTDPAFGAMYDFPLPDLRVKAAALNCGHYRFEAPEDGAPAQGVMAAYFGDRIRESLPLVDAFAHIGPAFPPTFVMTARYDFLRDQAALLADKLREQGVPFRYKLYGTEDQPYMAHVFHLNIRLPEARACNDEECGFFLENS